MPSARSLTRPPARSFAGSSVPVRPLPETRVFVGTWAPAAEETYDGQPVVGEVRDFPAGEVPAGWLTCRGQLLPVLTHASLYAVLGTAHGGDGRTTFAVPDLTDAEPADRLMCIAVHGVCPQPRSAGLR